MPVRLRLGGSIEAMAGDQAASPARPHSRPNVLAPAPTDDPVSDRPRRRWASEQATPQVTAAFRSGSPASRSAGRDRPCCGASAVVEHQWYPRTWRRLSPLGQRYKGRADRGDPHHHACVGQQGLPARRLIACRAGKALRPGAHLTNDSRATTRGRMRQNAPVSGVRRDGGMITAGVLAGTSGRDAEPEESVRACLSTGTG
jgi:hypothetical protein